MSLGTGGDSNDDCFICGTRWVAGFEGWVLCDACPNTVCPVCTSSLSLSVGEMFYCPACAGSGESAAAMVGGGMAMAVTACAELKKLPLSFRATRRILSNLVSKPHDMKYRKLRFENKVVKELIDIEPVMNILVSVGFTRRICERSLSENTKNTTNQTRKEEVLLLEGTIPLDHVNNLLEIIDGISSDSSHQVNEETHKNEPCEKITAECGKRKRDVSIQTNSSSVSNEKETLESNN